MTVVSGTHQAAGTFRVTLHVGSSAKWSDTSLWDTTPPQCDLTGYPTTPFNYVVVLGNDPYTSTTTVSVTVVVSGGPASTTTTAP